MALCLQNKAAWSALNNNISLIFCKRDYSRILKRRPLKVIYSDSLSGSKRDKNAKKLLNQTNQVGVVSDNKDRLRNGFKNSFRLSSKNDLDDNVVNGSSFKGFTLPKGVRFEKLERGDHRFGPVVMRAKSSKARITEKLILLEGKRLIEEAISASLHLKSLYFTKVEHLSTLPLLRLVQRGTMLYKVDYQHMKIWSDTVTSQGIMAVCEQPSESTQVSCDDFLPVTVVIDNIKDAGTMGTLVRSATAARCERILCTRGCIDVWESKVLRASAGAMFYARLTTNISWDMMDNILPSEQQLLLVKNSSLTDVSLTTTSSETDHSRNTSDVVLPHISYNQIEWSSHNTVVIITSLGDVSSSDAVQFCVKKNGSCVYVPNADQCNLSLGLVGSIVLFGIQRLLRTSS